MNNAGKQLLDYCASTQSFIANGRIVGDLQGKFTCHKWNGSSTVDYAVINESMSKYTHSFRVLDPDTGSDHSAIRLKINCPQKTQNNNNLSHIKKLKWNEDTKLLFEIKMKSSDTTTQISKLNHMLDHDASIEDIVKEFTNTITPKMSSKSKNNQPKKQKPKKWYDYSCFEMSKRLKNVAKLYAKTPHKPPH